MQEIGQIGQFSHPVIVPLQRDMPQQQQALREGRWQTSAGVGLNGKTLGVLGLGTLGSRVARIARAFEMNLIAWSRNLTCCAPRIS